MGEFERAVKMEQDLSAVVDAQLPEILEIAKSGNLSQAVDKLLTLEKQTRTAADLASTSRVLIQIIRLYKEANDWNGLNEQIVLLTKKHGQLKQAIAAMIQEAVTYVNELTDMTIKLSLIDTLLMVTEGKIYVEIERARLTRLLAKIREDEGKIAEAADVLQRLQVETFGSMDKREKVDFILEQMRLLLAKKDLVRTGLVSKKISSKFWEKGEHQDLKLRYFRLMIELASMEDRFLDVCKYYRQIYQTPSVLEDPQQWKPMLANVVVYVTLAPYDNEQSDLIHRVAEDKRLADLPAYRNLIQAFTTSEILRWDAFQSQFSKDIFSPEITVGTFVKDAMKVFQERVTEHNIRTIAAYYTRITMKRLTELLGLPEDQAEAHLSKLVVAKTVYARIDRIAGVVDFAPKANPNAVLNEWASSVHSLLGLIERTTHLIAKEEMVHKIAAK